MSIRDKAHILSIFVAIFSVRHRNIFRKRLGYCASAPVLSEPFSFHIACWFSWIPPRMPDSWLTCSVTRCWCTIMSQLTREIREEQWTEKKNAHQGQAEWKAGAQRLAGPRGEFWAPVLSFKLHPSLFQDLPGECGSRVNTRNPLGWLQQV